MPPPPSAKKPSPRIIFSNCRVVRIRIAALFVLLFSIVYVVLASVQLRVALQTTDNDNDDDGGSVGVPFPSSLRRTDGGDHRARRSSEEQPQPQPQLAFEGSSEFLSRLRHAHDRKMRHPPLACRDDGNHHPSERSLRMFHRGDDGEYYNNNATWIGHALPGVSSSCHFVSLNFPPHPSSINAALDKRTYQSPFHIARQCHLLKYDVINATRCAFKIGNLGLLGGSTSKEVNSNVNSNSQEGCVVDSAGGRHVKLWLDTHDGKYGTDAAMCLTRFLKEGSLNTLLNTSTSLSGWGAEEVERVEQFAILRRMDANVRKGLIEGLAPLVASEGYGVGTVKWNGDIFVGWANSTLLALAAAGGQNTSGALSAAAELAAAIRISIDAHKHIMHRSEKATKPLLPCMEPLLASPTWQQGLRLAESTMGRSPAPLLRSLPASSTVGAHPLPLPPPPHVVYARNAVVDAGAHVSNDEAYLPGCGPWWSYIANADMEKTFSGKGTLPDGPFASRAGNAKRDAELRTDILRECASSSGNDGRCPYPIVDKVVHLAQAHCDELYHVFVEMWPRIAPFLDGFLDVHDMDGASVSAKTNVIDANDTNGTRTRMTTTTSFSFHIGGCAVNDMHQTFFDLLGITRIDVDVDDPTSSSSSSSSSLLLGSGTPVFAKEVFVPTVGYSLMPLLNYWELMALRGHVERIHGSARTSSSTQTQKGRREKKVLVVVRDTGKRRRDDATFDVTFFEELTSELSLSSSETVNYAVVPFRSSDFPLMKCFLCQMRMFQEADVVIGSHGAGLSHLLWAKEGAVLLEVLTEDISTIYAQMAFLVGMKYFPMAGLAGAKDFVDVIKFASS